MYYVYILYSDRYQIYYVGHTNDPERRLFEHNTDERNKYTRKYRPWVMVFCYPVSERRSEAMETENYLKGRKSRSLIEKLISHSEDTEYLNQFFGKIKKKRVK